VSQVPLMLASPNMEEKSQLNKSLNMIINKVES
jgi:hypothetical protein